MLDVHIPCPIEEAVGFVGTVLPDYKLVTEFDDEAAAEIKDDLAFIVRPIAPASVAIATVTVPVPIPGIAITVPTICVTAPVAASSLRLVVDVRLASEVLSNLLPQGPDVLDCLFVTLSLELLLDGGFFGFGS
jgi:hypothetical protein